MKLMKSTLLGIALSMSLMTFGANADVSDLKLSLDYVQPNVECNTCFTDSQFKAAARAHFNEHYERLGDVQTRQYAVINNNTQEAVYMELIHFILDEPELGIQKENVFFNIGTPSFDRAFAYDFHVQTELAGPPPIPVNYTPQQIKAMAGGMNSSAVKGNIQSGLRDWLRSIDTPPAAGEPAKTYDGMDYYFRSNTLLELKLKDGYSVYAVYVDIGNQSVFMVLSHTLTKDGNPVPFADSYFKVADDLSPTINQADANTGIPSGTGGGSYDSTGSTNSSNVIFGGTSGSHGTVYCLVQGGRIQYCWRQAGT